MPANKREIRTRIKSVRNTQKITRAMQMVAAAKVRRAQDRVVAAKPYSEAIVEVFKSVAAQIPAGEYRSPLLAKRPVKRVAVVVITSDKGLCGGYNANATRAAVARLRYWEAEGVEPKLVIVGNKGIGFFKHSRFKVAARFSQFPQIPTFAEAQAIVAEAVKLYSDASVDRVEFIYTNFRTMMSLVPTTIALLPAALPEPGSAASTGMGGALKLEKEPVAKPMAQYIFEPSAAVCMDALIPKYLETVVYQALLESAASELAAKMTAMSAASKNAKELAEALSLVYNKARQSAITQEILEVVGGAAAL